MRIFIIADDLLYPLDEGFKKAICSIILGLKHDHVVFVAGKNIETELGHNFCKNRFMLSFRMWQAIYSFNPQVIIYFPMSSVTLGGFIRGRVLKLYSKAPITLVGFQPRTHGKISKLIIPLLKPDNLFVQSLPSQATFNEMGIRTTVFPSGVDTCKFSPVDISERNRLRQQYRLPCQIKIVLHVGHLNRNRGIDLLSEFSRSDVLPVVVTSTSTAGDKKYLAELRAKGVHVITDYIENIQELYQIADVYVFPTQHNSSAIEFPLSVLEALSCGVPVLSTKFGGLTSFFEDCSWFRFFDGIDDGRKNLPELFEIKEADRLAMRAFVEKSFSWQAVSAMLLADYKIGVSLHE